MTVCSDIIVIGGGMAGISAAAHLSAHAKVTVLEAETQLGYHATGRSAAIFIRNYGNETMRALNAIAYPVLSGQMSDEQFLSPRGELLVAQEHELDLIETFLEYAEGVDRLTAKEAGELVPPLRQEKIADAFIERNAQDIDVDRLLQHYVRLLRSRGGNMLTGHQVRSISQQNGLWQVKTEGDVFSANVVINAAGAWADGVAALAGITPCGLQPMRRSAVLMAVPESMGDTRNWPLFGSVAEDWYAKPEGAGLMVSPADEDPVSPQDAWPDDMVLAEGLYRFEQMVDIPIVKPSHSWAGLRTFTKDRTPVVGFEPEAEGFFWLAGQGGYGIQTAPALAKLACDLCTGEIPSLDVDKLAAMAPSRFRKTG